MSIIEVAQAAGVSIATVSRVINHRPGVSPTAVRAVKKAMDELGYQPPPLGLRRGKEAKPNRWPSGVRRGMIALLFPDSRNTALRTPLSGRYMHGVYDALAPYGMHCIATPLAADGGLPPCITDHGVDGVIIRGASAPILPIAPLLAEHACVWLMELTADPGHGDRVVEDTDMIGLLAAKHLTDLGAKRVAVLNHEVDNPCSVGRALAFQRHAEQNGLHCSAITCDRAIHRTMPEAVEYLIDRLLTLPVRPDSVYLPWSEPPLVVAHRALAVHGIIAGRDLRVITSAYENSTLAALGPTTANIDIQPELMAARAVETLLWRLAHPKEARRTERVQPRLDPIPVTLS